MPETAALSRERVDLLQSLEKHRGFLVQTLDGMEHRRRIDHLVGDCLECVP